MNYAFVSILSEHSTELPWVWIQMEALERALPKQVNTKRFLLSEFISDLRNPSQTFHWDRVFVFGLGKLTESESIESIHRKYSLPESSILLAVEVNSRGTFTPFEREIISRAANNKSPITVINEVTKAEVQKHEPSAEVMIMGCLESLLDISPITVRNKRIAHVNCRLDRAKNLLPSFKIVFDDRDRKESLEVGFADFYVSRFPWIGLKAMASSRCVVTSEERVARIALALKKPVLLFKKNPQEHRYRALVSDPELLTSEERWNLELERRDYQISTAEMFAQMDADKKIWIQFFDRFNADIDRKAIESSSESLTMAVVCDQGYLGYLVAFCQNLVDVHKGKIQLFVLWLSAESELNISVDFPQIKFQVIFPADIWKDQEWQRIRQWPVAERAYAAKPAILRKALESAKAPVLLSDLDMWYFKSPVSLLQLKEQTKVLMFLQWADRFEWLRHHGFINSGMVVAQPGAEAILRFWSDACAQSAAINSGEGLFGDQGFIDYAALHYEGCSVYRDYDQDVAPWNFKSLQFSIPDKARPLFRVRGNIEVSSFHAAGPDTFGAFELKYLWDQLCAFLLLKQDDLNASPQWKSVLEQQRLHTEFLSQFLWLRDRWKRRFPKLFGDSFQNVQWWLGKYQQRIVRLLKTVTQFIDKLRTPQKSYPDNFDRQWVMLQSQVVRSLESGDSKQ